MQLALVRLFVWRSPRCLKEPPLSCFEPVWAAQKARSIRVAHTCTECEGGDCVLALNDLPMEHNVRETEKNPLWRTECVNCSGRVCVCELIRMDPVSTAYVSLVTNCN